MPASTRSTLIIGFEKVIWALYTWHAFGSAPSRSNVSLHSTCKANRGGRFPDRMIRANRMAGLVVPELLQILLGNALLIGPSGNSLGRLASFAAETCSVRWLPHRRQSLRAASPDSVFGGNYSASCPPAPSLLTTPCPPQLAHCLMSNKVL